MFHHFDIDEICRSFWAKIRTAPQPKINPDEDQEDEKKDEQRPEPPRLKKLWSETEDDFLRNWSGSRPDATAALNAKFGTQRWLHFELRHL